MNIVAKWVLESVAATVVIVVCVGFPQALDLPTWTLAFSTFPVLLYLSWRLDGPTFAWRGAVLFAASLVALLLVQKFVLPQSWQRFFSFVISGVVASYFMRRWKETYHAV